MDFFQKFHQLFICKYSWGGWRSSVPQHWLRSEGSLQELVLSFQHASPRDRSQVVTLGNECLCLLSLLRAPGLLSFFLPCSWLKLEKQLILLCLEIPAWTVRTYLSRAHLLGSGCWWKPARSVGAMSSCTRLVTRSYLTLKPVIWFLDDFESCNCFITYSCWYPSLPVSRMQVSPQYHSAYPENSNIHFIQKQ